MMRRALTLLAAAVLLSSCDTSKEAARSTEATAQKAASAPMKAPSPPPRKLTAAELAATHEACFVAWLAKDAKRTQACYRDTRMEFVDSGTPPVMGGAQVVEHARAFWAAFPDISGATVLILANGNSVLQLGALTGTNRGPFAGQPATNKRMGVMFAELNEMTDDGRHTDVRLYLDMGTMAGQLGKLKNKTRPVMEKPSATAKVVTGTGSEAEKANAAVVTTAFEAVNRFDWKALEGLYAEDVTFAHMLRPADYKGRKRTIAAIKEIGYAFPGKANLESIWGAGDYVVAQETFVGTHSGPFKPLGLMKKTGKQIRLRLLHVFQFEASKVKKHWMFGNGLATARQLGLLPAPGGTDTPSAQRRTRAN